MKNFKSIMIVLALAVLTLIVVFELRVEDPPAAYFDEEGDVSSNRLHPASEVVSSIEVPTGVMRLQEPEYPIESEESKCTFVELSSSFGFRLDDVQVSRDNVRWGSVTSTDSEFPLPKGNCWVRALGHLAERIDGANLESGESITLEPDLLVMLSCSSASPPALLEMQCPSPKRATDNASVQVSLSESDRWGFAIDSSRFIEEYGTGETTARMVFDNGLTVRLQFVPDQGLHIHEPLTADAGSRAAVDTGFLRLTGLGADPPSIDGAVTSLDLWLQLDPQWSLAPKVEERSWGRAWTSWNRSPLRSPVGVGPSEYSIEGLVLDTEYIAVFGSRRSGFYGRRRFLFDGSTVEVPMLRAPLLEGTVESDVASIGAVTVRYDYGESQWTHQEVLPSRATPFPFRSYPVGPENIPRMTGAFPMPSKFSIELRAPRCQTWRKDITLFPHIADLISPLFDLA